VCPGRTTYIRTRLPIPLTAIPYYNLRNVIQLSKSHRPADHSAESKLPLKLQHPVVFCDVILITLLLLLSYYVTIFYVCQLLCRFIVIKSIKNKRLTFSAPQKTELFWLMTNLTHSFLTYLFHASTCFEQQVLVIRRAKLY
jgi:hypothetical protein